MEELNFEFQPMEGNGNFFSKTKLYNINNARKELF